MVRGTVLLASLAFAAADESNKFLALQRSTTSSGPSVPTGVNFGGWLCLEDWFYSGVDGTHVSTPNSQPRGQGACLPPLATQLSETWPSEGTLVKTLNTTQGPEKTAEIFMAHRRSFIGNRDLEAVRDLGIHTVRVPLTWAAFADALAPIDEQTYGSHNPDEDAVVVPDPFYAYSKALVTVPRSWLKMFLRNAHDHGLQVVLDMHAMPGASSDGTYNGVWPEPPKFWQETTTIGHRHKLTDAGHMISRAMIKWVEGLDKEERMAIKGLTLMNEPAHLSAFSAEGSKWAQEEQVLDWLAVAGKQFRHSKLPGMGIKLYMNIIETAFGNFWGTIPPWWNKTFTAEEQQRWAVMDIHWYTAWGGGYSSGRTVSGGGYFCDEPLEKIRGVLQRGISDHVKGVIDNFGDGGLKAISEFSLGTFDEALKACTDPAVLEMFLDEQVKAFQAADIEPFFWTWRMPYGPAFEPGWSLKHVMGKENVHQSSPCQRPSPMASVSARTLEI